MIRTLVAEDSITARELLVAILSSDPDVRVVGVAADGVEAIEKTRALHPDVVTMDVRMPRLDGFEATRRIMVETPTPIVIVSGSYDTREVEFALHALRAGALAVLPKPSGPGDARFEEESARFRETVKAMSQVKVVRRFGARPAPPLAIREEPSPGGERGRVLAIAASTGGPAALARLLPELSGDFPAPVLVVQHISPGFIGGLAAWLDALSTLPVKVAQDGEGLEPGRVYLAPDGRHLGVRGTSRVELSDGASIGGFRPSASHLFESVAGAFGPSAVALVLTGMGRDGVEGLAALSRAGGRVLVQDEASSVVFGMPGAAIEAELADRVVSLAAIPRELSLVFGTKEEVP